MNWMIELNQNIKFLGIEATAGSRYLLGSADFPEHCLQVVVGTNQDEPQYELLLIDRVITFNCFRELSETDIIEYNYLKRLSIDAIKKINAIFGYEDKNQNLSSTKNKKMYQKFICYRLNPNSQELGGEVHFDKNVDGRIFIDCRLDIKDNTAILIDEEEEIKAVLSLNHFYLLNVY